MKKLLLLLIIPFLSFGQCEDANACNYGDQNPCLYPQDGCNAIEGLGVVQYIATWDDDCNCICVNDTDGDDVCDELDNCIYDYNPNQEDSDNDGIGDVCICQDESACNYNQPFNGFFFNDGSGVITIIGGYTSPPFCLNPGDSCNVLNEMSVEPSPIGYSGVLGSNCECVCTNPENIYLAIFSPPATVDFNLGLDSCPEEGCMDILACNYNSDAFLDDDSCFYPNDCGSCDITSTCSCDELTYVPDDSFENYIETNFPESDNGIANDNYVLSSGIDFTQNQSTTTISFGESNLDDPIFDLTGIEDFKGVSNLWISGPSLLISTLDLSCLQLQNVSNGAPASISVSNCMFLENLILPPDTFNLTINLNYGGSLEQVSFQPEAYYNSIWIYDNWGLNSSLCYLDVKGSAINQNFSINVSGADMNVDLEDFNSSYGGTAIFSNILGSSWQIRFNDEIYDWTSVTLGGGFECVEVANTSYCEAYWGGVDIEYSSNCWNPSGINCDGVYFNESPESSSKSMVKVFDILGKETGNNKGYQLHIYDDGSVEKKYVIK